MDIKIYLDPEKESITDWSNLRENLQAAVSVTGLEIGSITYASDSDVHTASYEPMQVALEQTTGELEEMNLELGRKIHELHELEEAHAQTQLTLAQVVEERDALLKYCGITESDPLVRKLMLWLLNQEEVEVVFSPEEAHAMAKKLMSSTWMRDRDQSLIKALEERGPTT